MYDSKLHKMLNYLVIIETLEEEKYTLVFLIEILNDIMVELIIIKRFINEEKLEIKRKNHI
jgi:hypothetical protein